MPKTPDEIKKGLECCVGKCAFHNPCPYEREPDCFASLKKDALALIQSLQDCNAQLLQKVHELETKCHRFEAERDAAVNVLRQQGCAFCVHLNNEPWEAPCRYCCDSGRWQWRGVQKEDDDAR